MKKMKKIIKKNYSISDLIGLLSQKEAVELRKSIKEIRNRSRRQIL